MAASTLLYRSALRRLATTASASAAESASSSSASTSVPPQGAFLRVLGTLLPPGRSLEACFFDFDRGASPWARRFLLPLLLFHTSRAFHGRAAQRLWWQCIGAADNPQLYRNLGLPAVDFRAQWALLILHVWLLQTRLRLLRRRESDTVVGVPEARTDDGIHNLGAVQPRNVRRSAQAVSQALHELVMAEAQERVADEGVRLLATRWIKDMEAFAYNHWMSYDRAMEGEEELQATLWRNVFDFKGDPKGLQLLTDYVLKERDCILATPGEPFLKGAIVFSVNRIHFRRLLLPNDTADHMLLEKLELRPEFRKRLVDLQGVIVGEESMITEDELEEFYASVDSCDPRILAQ